MEKKLSRTEILTLFQHLHNLVKSGLPLDSSLREVAKEFKGPLKTAAEDISGRLAKGQSLPEALSIPQVGVNRYLTALLDAGVKSGNLSQVLYDIIALYQRKLRAEGKILANCRYPFMVMGILILLSLIMFTKLLPEIMNVYSLLGVYQVPQITEISFSISKALTSNVLLLIFIILLAAFFITNIWTLEIFKGLRSRMELLIPVVSLMVYYDSISIFSRSLSRMLKQNIPLNDALRLSKMTLRNMVYQDSVKRIADEVEKGKKFSEVVKESKFIPAGVSWSITLSEERGDLSTTLEEVANLYDEKFQDVSDLTAGYIEPVLLIIVGVFLGILIISCYLPLFNIPKIIG